MAQRRKITRRSETDWEKLLTSCLCDSIGTSRWGCLSKQGTLFRISTLRHTKIPQDIINSMKTKGLLVLKDDGYFKYVPRKPNRRKRIFK